MRPSLLITLCVAAGLFVGGFLLFLFPQTFGLDPQQNRQITTSGKALIGGPFSLLDHTGKRVSEKTYAGKFMLIFFGYTFCPDVCPTELQVMSVALDDLGSQAKRIQPLFITIDPDRDTVGQMAEYVSNFHSTLVGLTGSAQDIAGAAKSYRVFYARAKDDAEKEDYLMDHTSALYLMDEKGEFIKHFPFGVKPDEIVAEIKKVL